LSSKSRILVIAFVLGCMALATAGCVSEWVGRSAGGELRWWCPKCESYIDDPETHHCTDDYDIDTDIDQLLDTVGEKEGQAEAPGGDAASAVASSQKRSVGDRLRFWRRGEAPQQRKETPRPKARKRWQFWRR